MFDKKFHYTYVIHKESTGEYYIGVRSSNDEPNNDPYMGTSATLKERMKTEDDWFKFIIQTYATREEAVKDEYEQLKQHWRQTWCLNRSAGGTHYRERITSAETRAKLSAAGKRRVTSDETKAKLSAAHKGKKRSAEHQAKLAAAHTNPSTEKRAILSAAHIGKKHTLETRAKIAKASKNRWLKKELHNA